MRVLTIATVMGMLVIALLTGCLPAKGTVESRQVNPQASCPRGHCRTYQICVREFNDHVGCGDVTEVVYNACTVGKSWPKCKDEVSK